MGRRSGADPDPDPEAVTVTETESVAESEAGSVAETEAETVAESEAESVAESESVAEFQSIPAIRMGEPPGACLLPPPVREAHGGRAGVGGDRVLGVRTRTQEPRPRLRRVHGSCGCARV